MQHGAGTVQQPAPPSPPVQQEAQVYSRIGSCQGFCTWRLMRMKRLWAWVSAAWRRGWTHCCTKWMRHHYQQRRQPHLQQNQHLVRARRHVHHQGCLIRRGQGQGYGHVCEVEIIAGGLFYVDGKFQCHAHAHGYGPGARTWHKT